MLFRSMTQFAGPRNTRDACGCVEESSDDGSLVLTSWKGCPRTGYERNRTWPRPLVVSCISRTTHGVQAYWLAQNCEGQQTLCSSTVQHVGICSLDE